MSEQNVEGTKSEDEVSELSEAEGTSLAGAEPGDDDSPEAAARRTVGVQRWVQASFMMVALVCIWLLGHLISNIWYIFADPDEAMVTVASVVGGVLSAILLYRSPKVNGLTTEVASELVKVAWPSRQETSSSTVVVLITSVIAAAILGVFDAVWSAVTDLVYKV